MNILFFTPHAELWVHTVPEALIAKAMAAEGHKVRYLTCGAMQTYCAPMSAHRLIPGCSKNDYDDICVTCGENAKAIRWTYRFPMDTLANYLDDADKTACEKIADEAVASQSLSTEYLGVDVGAFAMYELTLMYKTMSTAYSDSQWAEYGIYLRNSILSLLAFSRYLKRHRPDVVTAFSPQYSNINPCLTYASQQGLKVLFMESGNNLSNRLGTMRVWDWRVHGLVNPALRYWDRSELHPVTEQKAKAVVGHLQQILNGSHFTVYSKPFEAHTDIRRKWSIRPDQKVALMTLSSYDEAYAAYLIHGFPEDKVFSDVFRTQTEWLKATIEWARGREDIFLIIRVHPRDFPNKRDSLRSEQSYKLEGLLRDGLPGNVIVNWPSDEVSLYELLEDADLILTGWSVTALEALIFGIPVVTYDQKLPSYPADIMLTGRSESEYYANIDKAIAQGWRIENSRNAFRWLAYNFVDATVLVSERFGAHERSVDEPSGSAPTGLKRKVWDHLRERYPILNKCNDLLDWKGTRNGAQLICKLIDENHDSLLSVRKAIALSEQKPLQDDSAIVDKSLKALHDLLYANAALPPGKEGLSQRIRQYLNSRGFHEL